VSGKLYGVGIGPGDPDLITLRAKRVLEEVNYICYPRKSEEESGLARDAVKKTVDYRGELKGLHFPMTQDKNRLRRSRESAARRMFNLLQDEKDLAFITIGNPLWYSTYNYMLNRLKYYDDFELETIPGVNSMDACAARLNLPLASGRDKIVVFPLTSDPEKIDETLEGYETVVFLKVSRDYEMLIDRLKKNGRAETSYLLSHCGREEEFITNDLDSYRGNEIPYMSIVVSMRKSQLNLFE